MSETLYDAETTERIGVATAEQIEASHAAGETGVILIDASGSPVTEGSWAAQQPGTRRVYTA